MTNHVHGDIHTQTSFHFARKNTLNKINLKWRKYEKAFDIGLIGFSFKFVLIS